MKLSFLTYNIRGDFWSADASKRLAEIASLKNVDVICLQEVVSRWQPGKETAPEKTIKEEADGIEEEDAKKKKKVPQLLEVLLNELKGEFEQLHFLCLQDEETSMGNAILYRKNKLQPIGPKYCRRFEYVSQRSPMEEMLSRITVPARRVIVSQKFMLGDTPIIFYNVHLDFYGRDEKRVEQISEVFDFWKDDREHEHPIEVVAGDFNTWGPCLLTDITEHWRLLYRYLEDQQFKYLTDGIPWTASFQTDFAQREFVDKGKIDKKVFDGFITKLTGHLKQKPDHVWMKGDFDVLSCERLDIEGSDHYPVFVEVDIKEYETAKN